MYIAGGISPLLLGLLVAMGVLAYKHRERYKAFLLSFINFEGLLVLEVRARMLAGGCARPRWLASLFLPQVCLELYDLAGDAFMTYDVSQKTKEWVQQIAAPYVGCLGVAGIASVYTIAKKLLLVRQRAAARNAAAEWQIDLASDERARQTWIGRMDEQDGAHYTSAETAALTRCKALFELFPEAVEVTGSTAPQTSYDAQRNVLAGKVQLVVPGATPQAVVAYLMESSRSCISRRSIPSSVVRDDVIEEVNAHHIVAFAEVKVPMSRHRTFLSSYIWQRLPGEASTFIWAQSPVPSHSSVRQQDEENAVRATAERCARLTAIPQGTLLEFVARLDLQSHLPSAALKAVFAPTILQLPNAILKYYTKLAHAELSERLETCSLELHKMYYVLLLGALEGSLPQLLLCSALPYPAMPCPARPFTFVRTYTYLHQATQWP
jgi:hypothetical protein